MNIGIIGSGISGLSLANMLKENNDVIVFEKEKSVGGLIKCIRVSDCLFHKVGGHVFNSKNIDVLNWFWSYFDKEAEFVQAKRNAKVLFNSKIVGYPIENYIYSFDKAIIKQIVSELLELEKQEPIPPFDYENFEAFLKGNFGETLYQIYFKPYNEKIWRIDLKEVAMEWLEGKLPMPNISEIFLNNVLREEDGSMVHSSFYYPKEGGSQFIVDRLRLGIAFETGSFVSDVSIQDGKIHVEGKVFDRLVYCGDIRKLPLYIKSLLAQHNIDLNAIDALRSNGTSNLFCETDDNDISWLYIPENFTKAHRIIFTGNFSETNNRGSARKTCVVEFSGEVAYEVMVEEIKKLPGNLSPLAYNYEPNSYVVQQNGTKELINAVKEVLEKYNIYLLGRFAEWEYYNMDKAVEAAFKIRDKIENKN
jgi:protoporphyrinogen oxidase